MVIAKYNLNENKHVVGLYEIKEFWVPPYLRGFFFGGMTTTGRSESINAFIKRFISSRKCLNQFVRQVSTSIFVILFKSPYVIHYVCLNLFLDL